jgi:hypothetical protein
MNLTARPTRASSSKATAVAARVAKLARRLLRAAGKEPKRSRLIAVYAELCRHLAEGRQFLGLD